MSTLESAPAAATLEAELKPTSSMERPSWIRQLEIAGKQYRPEPGRRLSLDELLDLESKRPGGKERVEKAKAFKSAEATAAPMSSPSLLAYLLRPAWQTSNAYAYFHGAILYPGGGGVPDWLLHAYVNHAPLPTVLTNAGANIGFSITAPGWYLVNLRTSTADPGIAAWKHSGYWEWHTNFNPGDSVDHTVLIFLGAAGLHHVYYALNLGEAYVHDVEVWRL